MCEAYRLEVGWTSSTIDAHLERFSDQRFKSETMSGLWCCQLPGCCSSCIFNARMSPQFDTTKKQNLLRIGSEQMNGHGERAFTTGLNHHHKIPISAETDSDSAVPGQIRCTERQSFHIKCQAQNLEPWSVITFSWFASPIYAHVEQSRFSGGIGHNRTRKSLDFYSAKLLQIYYLKG